jgi:DNA-binding transcriptional regulator YhcF (GntR family)
MKKIVVFGLFLSVMLATQSANTQSVDDIVTKYMDAYGGKDKLISLKTVKMEGSMSAQGADLTITSIKSHMVGSRLDIEVMGTSNYQVVNTTKGSSFWPIRQMAGPADMEEEQYKSAYNQLDLQGALVNYKEKGTQVDYVGTEKVDGADAYKLKITFKNGVVSNYFIDAKTNRLVKMVAKQSGNGKEMEIETSYGDYKQNADGYWFPYTVTTPQGSIYYDKITTNLAVDVSLFKI